MFRHPRKAEPTPIFKRIDGVELDEFESISLGGGDQTGLAPAVHGEVVAAASASGEVYLLNSELDEVWDVDLGRTILGGTALNSTNVYVITSDAVLVALARGDDQSIQNGAPRWCNSATSRYRFSGV